MRRMRTEIWRWRIRIDAHCASCPRSLGIFSYSPIHSAQTKTVISTLPSHRYLLASGPATSQHTSCEHMQLGEAMGTTRCGRVECGGGGGDCESIVRWIYGGQWRLALHGPRLSLDSRVYFANIRAFSQCHSPLYSAPVISQL